MDVRSGYTNVQSEWGLTRRILNRMHPFDEYRLEPGGWLPTPDYEDIKSELFSDVTSPVFFNNNVANQANYSNAQTWRRAIERAPNYDGSTKCGSRWYIPQAANYSGCLYPPVPYMEADSLYAPNGPVNVRQITAENQYLMRDVRVSDVSSGSIAR